MTNKTEVEPGQETESPGGQHVDPEMEFGAKQKNSDSTDRRNDTTTSHGSNDALHGAIGSFQEVDDYAHKFNDPTNGHCSGKQFTGVKEPEPAIKDPKGTGDESLGHGEEETENVQPAPHGASYRMETGEDLVKFKQCRPPYFPANAWCIEGSWEVANKQGGIYTVLRSKAAISCKEFRDRYLMLGPLKPSHIHEVEHYSPPPCSPLARVVQACRDRGWHVITGHWLIDGNPRIVLFDLGSAAHSMDGWKQELFEKTQIGIPHSDIECNDTVILGFMMAQFIAEFNYQVGIAAACSPSCHWCRSPAATASSSHQSKASCPRNPNNSNSNGNNSNGNNSNSNMVVVHMHEWMAGVPIILLRLWKVNVGTVFTTHATLLGRHLCAGAMDFYNYLPNFNVDEEAGKRKIYHRYCLERAAASMANVFTTVSDITGDEAMHLIKRRPDMITPNGLNVRRITHEFQNLHQVFKEKIQKFIHGHFYGHINFNLDRTLFFFIAGRYEFGNKGGDIFIEALARLNHYLKMCGSDVTVIAFIIFPAKNNSFNVEALKGHAITKSLQETIAEIQSKVGKKIYDGCSRGQPPQEDTLLDNDDIVKLKRVILASHRSEWPPITTHNIVDEAKDPVMCGLKRCNLLNAPDDRVKVVFHPDFLNSDNPLLGLTYEEFIRGCHLGCFPSYYEPWGYTPAECTVMGIPSITSNLSGFGCFVQDQVSDPQSYGIYIIDRRFISVEESVRTLAQYMFDFSQLSRRQRIIMRNRTERLSDLLDWKRLHVYYTKARVSALCEAYPNYDPQYAQASTGSNMFRFSCPASSFSSLTRRQVDDCEDENEEDYQEDGEGDEGVLDGLCMNLKV